MEEEVGFITSVRNFLVRSSGLPTIKVHDMVETEAGEKGWVNTLLADEVEVLMLSKNPLLPGQLLRRSPKPLSVPAGEYLLGRTLSPLGEVIDGKKPLPKDNKSLRLLEPDKTAHGIDKRQFITEQFDTGITLIDTLIPLGKGQRELILCDARSGKTDFLVDVVANQKKTKTICIFALIGKSVTEVRNLIDVLQESGALSHTVVIASSSSDPVPLIFLTPYTATTLAEYFQEQGRDVLVIFDDMGIHAKFYREMALLGNKVPARESYPGDIFSRHARFLERAGNFKKEAGGGSITALPVIEINLSDFTTYIPTNLMSITDGHLMFRSSFYNQGQRPAIDIAQSVSRVGKQTQKRLQNKLADTLRQILSRAGQLEILSIFATELSYETQLILRQKELIMELLKQDPFFYLSKELQTVLLALVLTDFLKNKEVEFVKQNKGKIIKILSTDKELSNFTGKVFKMESEEELLGKLKTFVAKLEALCPP